MTKILAATERDFGTLQLYYYYKQLFISLSYFSPLFVQSSLGLLRWLDCMFQGVYCPILSVYFVGINKDIRKKLPHRCCLKFSFFTAVMYEDENFFLIHVLLASEFSWQRNDASLFFTCLCISQCQEVFLEIA